MSELYVLSTWAEWQTADSVYSANLRYRGSDRGGGRRWEEVGGGGRYEVWFGRTGRIPPWGGVSQPRSIAGGPCPPSRVRARISGSLRRELEIYTRT
jgi:hypothetical protein